MDEKKSVMPSAFKKIGKGFINLFKEIGNKFACLGKSIAKLYLGPSFVIQKRGIKMGDPMRLMEAISVVFSLVFLMIFRKPAIAFKDLGKAIATSFTSNYYMLIINLIILVIVSVGSYYVIKKKKLTIVLDGLQLLVFSFSMYFLFQERSYYVVTSKNWFIWFLMVIPQFFFILASFVISSRFFIKLLYVDSHKEQREEDYNNRIINYKKTFKRFGVFMKKNWGQVLVVIALIILAIEVLYPLCVMIIRSFKFSRDDLRDPFAIPSRFTFENYTYMWSYLKNAYINSLITTLGVTLGVLVIASMVAFAYVRFTFPGKNFLFYAIIGLMMIPGILTLISRFQIVNDLGLLSNLWGIILPGIAGGIPFSFMLLFTFFKGIPHDLFEAADIDGSSDLGVFRHVVLPLSKPILWTIAIQSFVGEWNDYLWAKLVIGSKESLITLPVLLQSISSSYESQSLGMGAPFAGYVLSAIPLVLIFIVASKQFIEGLTSGAFKM